MSDGCVNCAPGELCPSFSTSGPHEPKYICGTHELFIDNKGDMFFFISRSKCGYFDVRKNNSQQKFDRVKGI